MKFSDLSLIPQILMAAAEAGYETPSPIQEKAIPPVLTGRDLLGCAQTGTGKTAAFAMPILQRLQLHPVADTPAAQHKSRAKRPIRALILTPTRELALQIDESFSAYGKHLPLKGCVIFGGVNQNPQVAQLQRGVDILTATPGRLNDLINQGHIDLSRVEIFVLDEADRMLDMGFVHDVKRVLTYLPKQKQTLLFSATMPREIEELADGLLHNPAKVMVTPPATTVERIDQSVYFVDKNNKRHLLSHLLENPAVLSALVFTRTKHGADRVVKELARDGVTAMAIHGNKSQNARQDALAKFKDGRLRVLVATDIAARGIDINDLSHVFNYDLPNIPETYVHRIGRTGRAGQPGIAISFCDFEEKAYLADIEKLIRLKIPVHPHAWPMEIFEILEKQTQQRPARGSFARGQAPARDSREAVRPAKHRTAAAPATQRQTQSEERKMEETSKPRPQAGAAGHTAEDAQTAAGDAKHRRRRGGKRHNKTGATPPQPNAAQPVAAAQTENRSRPAQRQPGTQQGVAAQNGTPRTPKPARPQVDSHRREESAPAKNAVPAPATSDDSLQVISRKATVQKFASFDDYMKAHGPEDEE